MNMNMTAEERQLHGGKYNDILIMVNHHQEFLVYMTNDELDNCDDHDNYLGLPKVL